MTGLAEFAKAAFCVVGAMVMGAVIGAVVAFLLDAVADWR